MRHSFEPRRGKEGGNVSAVAPVVEPSASDNHQTCVNTPFAYGFD